MQNKQLKPNLNDSFESIYKSLLKFLDPLSTQETYKQVVEEAIRIVGATHGSIFIKEGSNLKRMYTSSPQLYKKVIFKNSYLYKALRAKQSSIFLAKKIEKPRPLVANLGIKSTIYIALVNKNEPVGVLALDCPKIIKHSNHKINILKAFSSVATLAIRNSMLHENIKSANEARDLFISIASHELKTPLTSIKIYTQLLNKKFSKTKKPEAMWTEKINMELSRLIMLINEFLSVENIKSGQLQYNLSQCSLKKIAQTAVEEFKKIYNRTVIFKNELKGSDEVIGDSQKLSQVISNLLDNANKFSEQDKPIMVNMKSNHKTIVLSIEDQGKGISKKEISRIFERFYKSDAKDTNGMGLGLFLTKNIVDYHKGQIEVHSRPNKGTVVNVKLPKSVNFNKFNF